MSLPVSMDDKDLFPKDDILDLKLSMKSDIDATLIKQMMVSLNRLWWSRLVISVRGYVINYVQKNDDVLFSCDDAFIQIHKRLAEINSNPEEAFQYLHALFGIIREKNELIQLLSNPGKSSQSTAIFEKLFAIVHGGFNSQYLKLTIAQLPAFTVFIKVVVNLQQRWVSNKEKKRSIRFETDPEWEPDERVVLFQTFASDNRTWILLDFDRYILQQWKPTGTSVIFGDRFVEKKKRGGLKLCVTCGMIEQKVDQFAKFNSRVFCSKECFDESNIPVNPKRGATIVQI